MLPHGVQEREDTLRSELKIRGGETIKSELAGPHRAGRRQGHARREEEGRQAASRRDGPGRHGKEGVEVTSKPLFLYGRYTKPRGVAQRRLFCEECNGRGCERCQGTGYSDSPSVEGLVSKRLGASLGSKKFKFTWFGSEDPDSMVFPPGRPMVIESKNPRRRRAPKALRLRTGKGSMSVSGLRVVTKKFEHPAFTFMTRAVIRAERRVAGEDVTRLQREMRNALVQYRNNKGRLVDKKIYFVKGERPREEDHRRHQAGRRAPGEEARLGRGRLAVVLRVDEDAATLREVRHNEGMAQVRARAVETWPETAWKQRPRSWISF